jgi:hypothetical protein
MQYRFSYNKVGFIEQWIEFDCFADHLNPYRLDAVRYERGYDDINQF